MLADSLLRALRVFQCRGHWRCLVSVVMNLESGHNPLCEIIYIVLYQPSLQFKFLIIG